jgi:hypothetical protein
MTSGVVFGVAVGACDAGADGVVYGSTAADQLLCGVDSAILDARKCGIDGKAWLSKKHRVKRRLTCGRAG